MSGTATSNGGVALALADFRLRGREIGFAVTGPAGRRNYRGRIEGAEMIPDPEPPAEAGWRGQRVG